VICALIVVINVKLNQIVNEILL